MILLQDALEISAEFVDGGGLCADNPKVATRVNQAISRLLETDDYNFTLDRIRFFTKNNSITLPREYVAARMVGMDGTPIPLDSIAYEFLEAGPGLCRYEQLTKLVDEGTGFPVCFDVPPEGTWYLLAYSTATADTTKTIRVTSRHPVPAFDLPINRWASTEGVGISDPAISTDPCASVKALVLPDGLEGYITLYAYDPTTFQHYFLSKYHPDERAPGYRRYRLPRFDRENGVSVQLLCKKQYLPATLVTDVLLIQNLSAIKLMVMGIEQENNRDVNGAIAYQQLALGQMQKQQSNESRGIRFNFVCPQDGAEVNII